MTHFDVFNGDADGSCSLLQLRFATPIDSVLITGAKRDIALLQRVYAQPGDEVTSLDISVAVNRQSLLALLDSDVRSNISIIISPASCRSVPDSTRTSTRQPCYARWS